MNRRAAWGWAGAVVAALLAAALVASARGGFGITVGAGLPGPTLRADGTVLVQAVVRQRTWVRVDSVRVALGGAPPRRLPHARTLTDSKGGTAVLSVWEEAIAVGDAGRPVRVAFEAFWRNPGGFGSGRVRGDAELTPVPPGDGRR